MIQKIVCISDTHLQHDKITEDIPECDLLIHAGDISYKGKQKDLYSFLSWFNKQPARHKVFISGNHDLIFQKQPKVAWEILKKYPDIKYLQSSSEEIEGLKIWGSPYTPRFFDWAFNLDPDDLEHHWSSIPDDTDIVISHGPMWSVGDEAPRRNHKGFENVGCRALLYNLTKRVRPILHICGHIHEGYGAYKKEGIRSINAAVLDGKYIYKNKPILIEIKEKEIIDINVSRKL